VIIRTALAVSAFALLGACAGAPKAEMVDFAPLERLSDAMTPDLLMSRGYYDQAALAYRSALANNPEDHPARFGLAEAQRLGGKLDAAATEYTKLSENPQWNGRAMEGLGRIALNKGDRAGALDKFSIVVAQDPTAWHSWLAIAQLNDIDKQWAKADEAYALALASSKEPANVYNNHGVSMMARGEPAVAAELFRNALAADPKLTRAATNLDMAVAATGQAASLDSGNGDARERARKLNNYGYVAALQGRDEDAKRYYEAAVKEHPSFYALAFNNLKTLQTAEESKVEPAKKK